MRRKVLLLVLTLLLFVDEFVVLVHARDYSDIASFRKVAGINITDLDTLLITPRVVKFLVPDGAVGTMGIFEIGQSSLQPYDYVEEIEGVTYSVHLVDGDDEQVDLGLSSLSDGNSSTGVNLPYAFPGQRVSFVLEYSKPVSANALYWSLAENSASPHEVALMADIDSLVTQQIAMRPVSGNSVVFPVIAASRWYVEFSLDQPVRMNELGVKPVVNTLGAQKYICFVARSSEEYEFYYEADRSSSSLAGLRVPGLCNKDDLLYGELVDFRINTYFVPSDQDADGISSEQDNCPLIANRDQSDVNNNRVGDACEDFDADGVLNVNDNCIDYPNLVQKDVDQDGIGDACDGVESRLAERYVWLPWLGIGLGFIVVAVLLGTTMRDTVRDNRQDIEIKNE